MASHSTVPTAVVFACALLIMFFRQSSSYEYYQVNSMEGGTSWSSSGSYSWDSSSSGSSYSFNSFSHTSSVPMPDPIPPLDSYRTFGTGDIPVDTILTVQPTGRIEKHSTVPQALFEVKQHNPTTHLVTSATFGDFFVASGRTIPPGEAKIIAAKPDICSCKVHCWSAWWCVAVSGIKLSNGTVTCYFADDIPTVKADANDEATYFVFIDRIEADMYTIARTNEVYISPTTAQSLPDGDIFCHNLPGFRLAVFITKAETDTLFTLLDKIGSDVHVSLTRGETQDGDSWGDGILYRNSYHIYYTDGERLVNGDYQSQPHYRIRVSDRLIGDTNGEAHRTLCQGYLFGI